ncbi:MAG TPA: bifunctional 5,10-methylenetetrahydrofolate dehydrogenase/5,10-methenyltetrahydrofolate cyclohydrolase [Syntrophomonadaceae bacterium]|nr:bifunctional 5,10-methylenetetrahydrofolate dehydrogenase/5,10-methenyltetrahydrofolate cyclohydrolase [Syntrophomonadaceae bacterium]
MAKTNILYGKTIAGQVLNQVAEEVKELKEKGIVPLLMTLGVGEDQASRVYMTSQRRSAENIGINFESMEMAAGTSHKRLLGIIRNINSDSYINGLIMQMPLPAHVDSKLAQWSISTRKDVEGVTPYNLGRMFLGVPGLMPCTAQAIIAMIKSTGVNLKGKEAVVVGQSDIVGKPTAIMLVQEEATVSMCHVATAERGMLEEHVRRADILVVAVGKPNVIKGEWIKEGAIVIDAGINTVHDKIVGDVEFEAARQRAAFITPVPGGVGAVTVAYLMKNTVEAVRWQTSETEEA